MSSSIDNCSNLLIERALQDLVLELDDISRAREKINGSLYYTEPPKLVIGFSSSA